MLLNMYKIVVACSIVIDEGRNFKDLFILGVSEEFELLQEL
jgi:hypothetical protein